MKLLWSEWIMKRYTMMNDYGEDISQADPIESEEGEWVKYEDVEKEIDRLKAANGSQLLRQIAKESTYLDSVVLHSDSVECNCEKTVLELIRSNPNQKVSSNTTYWICPAHGYKKI